MALLRHCLGELRRMHGEALSVPPVEVGYIQQPPLQRSRMRLAALPGTPQPMHRWPGFGGVELAGDSWGRPGSPIVILLHGLGQTRHAWGNTGSLLASAGYQAITYDARGHGDSDWAADGDYSRDAMISDLKSVISGLGQRPVSLVGASMGGGISLIAVGEGHVVASALVLVDFVPLTESAGVERIKQFMRLSSGGFDSLDAVATTINCYRPRKEVSRNLTSLAKNVRLGENGKYHWHWDPLLLERPPISRSRQIASSRNLNLPTLAIRGEMSDVVTTHGINEFKKLCPHCEFVEVPGAGHMVAGDRNDIFSHAVAPFLLRTVAMSP